VSRRRRRSPGLSDPPCDALLLSLAAPSVRRGAAAPAEPYRSPYQAEAAEACPTEFPADVPLPDRPPGAPVLLYAPDYGRGGDAAGWIELADASHQGAWALQRERRRHSRPRSPQIAAIASHALDLAPPAAATPAAAVTAGHVAPRVRAARVAQSSVAAADTLPLRPDACALLLLPSGVQHLLPRSHRRLQAPGSRTEALTRPCALCSSLRVLSSSGERSLERLRAQLKARTNAAEWLDSAAAALAPAWLTAPDGGVPLLASHANLRALAADAGAVREEDTSSHGAAAGWRVAAASGSFDAAMAGDSSAAEGSGESVGGAASSDDGASSGAAADDASCDDDWDWESAESASCGERGTPKGADGTAQLLAAVAAAAASATAAALRPRVAAVLQRSLEAWRARKRGGSGAGGVSEAPSDVATDFGAAALDAFASEGGCAAIDQLAAAVLACRSGQSCGDEARDAVFSALLGVDVRCREVRARPRVALTARWQTAQQCVRAGDGAARGCVERAARHRGLGCRVTALRRAAG